MVMPCPAIARLDPVEVAARIDHGADLGLVRPDQGAVLLEGGHRNDSGRGVPGIRDLARMAPGGRGAACLARDRRRRESAASPNAPPPNFGLATGLADP